MLRLQNLSPEDLFVLLHNIREVYALGDPSQYLIDEEGMKQFMNHCGSTLGADFYLTPRDAVKAFVGLLSVMEQNPGTGWQSLLPQTVIDRTNDPETDPSGSADDLEPDAEASPREARRGSGHRSDCRDRERRQTLPDQPPRAFDRLHPMLQEALYRMRWTKLRSIQVDAIHWVFDGNGDLIIAARTAAGKTEAAFLPIFSQVVGQPARGVRVVYAGPLKALINDQFRRLEELCQEAEIPVHKWHGDVSRSAKRKLLEEPSGVLLITPESIESLFVNHPHKLSELFVNLDYIVIDELHSFIGTERGAHLRSLIHRLASKSRREVRHLGLSATLGSEIGAVRRWLRPSSPDAVRVIEDPEKKPIKLRIQGYLRHGCPEKRHKEMQDAELDERLAGELETDVFDAFNGKTALVFANRKSFIELFADFARREAERRGLAPALFRVHHGSLSKGEREDTEEALKSSHPTATFCSSTLELGIDVGNVEIVGQIGPPWSVSSLIQRLGRSGRKEGEASVIRVFIEEESPDQHSSLFARLFPRLLQAIAMTELMLEKWCEPPEIHRLHLSTLIQQVLSVIAELGGARADELFGVLIVKGAFANVDQPTFIQVLRSMAAADLIEQTPEGLLITGLRGERIVRSHDFYVAFVVHEEYKVSHAGHHIGSIAMNPEFEVGGFLILAGRRWMILEIDHERKAIAVEPSPAGRVPDFHPDSGIDIHPRVREKMRQILGTTDLPIYLDTKAREMLTQARSTARDAVLMQTSFLQEGPDAIWFTWSGTRIQRTLYGLGTYVAGFRVADEGIALVFEKTSVSRVKEAYASYLTDGPDALNLALKFPIRVREKYEGFLSDELTARLFARANRHGRRASTDRAGLSVESEHARCQPDPGSSTDDRESIFS